MIEQASLVLGNGNWAVKSDSLLGYKTIDGKYYPREFTFTRATTGTRVNEAGLVELVPYNLLRYSEEFDNAVWSKTSVTVTVNATTSPSGVLTADKLIPSGLDSYVRYMSFNGTAGSVYTFSFYAKADVITNIRIRQFNATELNGTLEYITINNQWQRFTVTSTCAVNQQVQLWIGGSATWSTGEDIYVWGAQLVEGTEPLDYLPTTDRLDIPRIDYSTGEPVLLLEPQRTNLTTYSEQFDDASWNKINSSVTANADISPDGYTNADRIYDDAASGQHRVGKNISVVSATTYTFSVFAKKGSLRYCYLLTVAGGATDRYYFDLQDGVSITAGGKIEDYGSGWYRISAQVTAAATGNELFTFNLANSSSNTTYSGTGTGYHTIYGYQVEAGSYQTSYIPTTSASVTRNQDVCSKTGATALIGQTEGTLYAEFNITNLVGDRTILEIGADNSNRIRMRINGNTISASVVLAGSVVFSITFFSQPLGNYKFAYAYKQNDFQAYLNGNAGTAVTSGNIPSSMSIIGVGTRIVAADIFNDSISTAALWKERLSDLELATLTTL